MLLQKKVRFVVWCGALPLWFRLHVFRLFVCFTRLIIIVKYVGTQSKWSLPVYFLLRRAFFNRCQRVRVCVHLCLFLSFLSLVFRDRKAGGDAEKKSYHN